MSNYTEAMFLNELVSARSSEAIEQSVRNWIDEHGEDGFVPIGRDSANARAMEAMKDAVRAHNEIVTNSFDALVDFAEKGNLFNPPAPTNATEALDQAAEMGAAVMVATTFPADIDGRVDYRTSLRNVTTSDEALGVEARQFGSTIMQTGESVKISNPLALGMWGQGWKATLGFSKNGFALVASISASDPDYVAFTVTRMMFYPGWKAASYQWLTDGNGSALRVALADLPEGLIARPSEVTAQNSALYADKLVIGATGLFVRLYQLEGFSKVSLYNHFRENNFGIRVPVALRYGDEASGWRSGRTYHINDDVIHDGRLYRCTVETTSATKFDPANWKLKDVKGNNARGLRFSLNAGSGKYPVRDSYHDIPLLVENGQPQATMSLWALDFGKDPKKSPVAETINDKDRSVFITVHGQTHVREAIYHRLKNSGLPFLDGHVIIEIRCDNMSADFRRDMFTSNREGVRDSALKRLKNEIDAVLRELKNQRLGHFHDEILQKSVSGSSKDTKKTTDRFHELLGSSLVGNLFASFGGARRKNETPNNPSPRTPKAFVPLDPPTEIKVRGMITMSPGERSYIGVMTNAPASYGPHVSLALPPFVKEISRMPMKDGRVAFYVQCDNNAQIGQQATVTGKLDDGKTSLTAKGMIMVAAKEPRQQGGGNGTKLDVVPQEVHGLSDPNWRYLHADGMEPEKVAFDHQVLNGKLYVYWNTQFGAYTSLQSEGKVKWKNDAECLKSFGEGYLTMVLLNAMAEAEETKSIEEAVGEAPQASSKALHHLLRASAMKAGGVMAYEAVERRKKTAPRKEAPEAAGVE
jgi:hypothetical protein